MSRRGTEEEQEQKRNGKRRAGAEEEWKKKSRKIGAKIRIMRKLAKISTGAIFGTMPILALILALEQKLALVPILALVWCKLRPCRKIGIGANFGIGFWH